MKLEKKKAARLPTGLPPDGSIDAGLLLLSLRVKPGCCLSHTDISIVCGCHRGYISLIEKAALRKLRRLLSRETNVEVRHALSSHISD